MRPRVIEGVARPPSALRLWLRGVFGPLVHLDWWILLVTLAVGAMGVVCIYSAGYRGPDQPASLLWQRQLVWLGLGLAALLVVARLDYRWLCRWGWVFYAASIALLVATMLAGLVAFGARRWIMIGPFQVQPSEFAKLGLILALAGWLGDKGRDPNHWSTVAVGLAFMLVPFTLILKQPDLGSAMVLAPLTLAMLFVGRTRMQYLLLVLAAGMAMAPFAYKSLKPYQQKRLVVFLKGGSDPKVAQREAWNLVQSKIAVGSGGVWGKGWQQGSQSPLGFLPVATKDFIFSVFAEERGFVGSALLLLAYGVLIGLGLKIAAEAADPMGTILAVGVVTMLFFHVVVNVGMTIGLLPITGLPLPLMSYGGSFVVTTLLALGLLQSVKVHRRLY